MYKKNHKCSFFCQVNYKGKDIYIDVRGMTININDIISMYISGEDYKIVSYDFTDEKILNRDEKHGHQFAKHVINKYSDFSDIDKLEVLYE